MARTEPRGVLAPVITPFDTELGVDTPRYLALCRRLLAEGCDGLVPFGSTSEAAALSLDEKLALLDALPDAGVPAERLIPGTGLCALPETVRLTRAAVATGSAGVLLLPPFFYKHIDDDGLYAYTAEVIRRVNDDRLRIYLYHIPPMAGVGWSPELVARLARDFPETVIGLKDSGGDPAYARAVLERLPGFAAFTGNERFLGEILDRGGAGTITATANVAAGALARLVRDWGGPGAGALNEQVCAYRRALETAPVVEGTKAVRAHLDDDPALARVRPPLRSLPEAESAALIARLGQDRWQ